MWVSYKHIFLRDTRAQTCIVQFKAIEFFLAINDLLFILFLEMYTILVSDSSKSKNIIPKTLLCYIQEKETKEFLKW